MINYDKDEIKNNLDVEQIFELLEEWGGEPEYTDFGLTSLTICHNPKGEDGSRKLYYYDNSKLFQCWTSCGGFDIFELVLKIADLQWGKNIGLNEAIRWITFRFGISGEYIEADELKTIEDWEILANYNKLKSITIQDNNIILEKYDKLFSLGHMVLFRNNPEINRAFMLPINNETIYPISLSYFSCQ